MDLLLRRLQENGAEATRLPREEAKAFAQRLAEGLPGAAFGKTLPQDLRPPSPSCPRRRPPWGSPGPSSPWRRRGAWPSPARTGARPTSSPYPPGLRGGEPGLRHPPRGPPGPPNPAQGPGPPLRPLQERRHRPGNGQRGARAREARGGRPGVSSLQAVGGGDGEGAEVEPKAPSSRTTTGHQTKLARPAILSTGIGPKVRESSEPPRVRLSPMTK